MKKILLILIALPMIGFGQGWEKHIGNNLTQDFGNSFLELNSGFLCIGTSESCGTNSNSQGIVSKVDINGNVVWIQNYTDTTSIDLYAGIETPNNNFLLVGEKLGQHYLLKIDGNGNKIFETTFNTALSSGIRINNIFNTNNNNNYMIVGYGSSNNNYEISMLEINSSGNLIGNSIYQCDSTINEINFIRQADNGKFLFTGEYNNYPNYNKCSFILSLNPNATLNWLNSYCDYLYWYESTTVINTNDGGYAITGGKQGGIVGHAGTANLIKTNSNGIFQWEKTYDLSDTSSMSWALDVFQTNDNGYILTGQADDSLFLLKVDSLGMEEWKSVYGTSEWDMGVMVKQINNSGFVAIGVYELLDCVSGSIILIKTDSNGNVTSTFNIPTPSLSRKLEKVVDVLGRKTKGKTNQPLFYIYDDGTVEKRIVIE